MNSFGTNFRITIIGESHSKVLGVVIDGVRAGIALNADDFAHDISRRRAGAKGTTARHESDIPRLITGLYKGRTTGAPLTIVFNNKDIVSRDYDKFVSHPRPSHADLVAKVKYGGWNDPRGGGRFSGRLSLCLVTAGVVAKKMLGNEIRFDSRITEIGGEKDPAGFEWTIAEAIQSGDSVGGMIQCIVEGVEVGVGEPFFDSVESMAAHLIFSIPGVKGIEFGRGFGVASARGSDNNDVIINAQGETKTNNDGGVNGGITNGNPIVVNVAVKPSSSIPRAQQTYNFEKGEISTLEVAGRHDACFSLRAAVVVESAMAIVLADLSKRYLGSKC